MVGGTVNLLLNVIFYSMIKDIHVAALTTLTSFIVIAIVIRKKTTNYDYCSSKSLIRFVGSVMLSSFLMSLGGWYIETNYFLEKEGVQSVFILILLSMMIYVFVLSLLNVSKYREFMNEIRITSIMS